MPEILFNDKKIKPDDRLLAEKIGKNFKHMEELQKHIKKKYGDGYTAEGFKYSEKIKPSVIFKPKLK